MKKWRLRVKAWGMKAHCSSAEEQNKVAGVELWVRLSISEKPKGLSNLNM